MFPSFVTNLIWGEESINAAKQQDAAGLQLNHTISEEQDEWMVIHCNTNPSSGKLQTRHEYYVSRSVSSVRIQNWQIFHLLFSLSIYLFVGEPINENESVCSEASEQSWIVEPSPRFRSSKHGPSLLPHHSLEDLLIEHPNMSVYAGATATPTGNPGNENNSNRDPKNMQLQLRNQNTQLVLYRNHVRQQLAAGLGIPVCPETIQKQQIDASSTSNKKSGGKKHSYIKVSRGKKAFKIHQCGVKAGRRRC